MGSDKKVKAIIFDWFYTTDNGEEYCCCRVGEAGVTKIEYHPAMGEGDRHYCDVCYEDGSVIRQFNLNSIEFE